MSLWQFNGNKTYNEKILAVNSGCYRVCRKEVDSDHSKHVMRRCYQLLKYFLENLSNYLRIFVYKALRSAIRQLLKSFGKIFIKLRATQLFMTELILIRLWCQSFNSNYTIVFHLANKIYMNQIIVQPYAN